MGPMEMPAEPQHVQLDVHIDAFRPDEAEAVAELARTCASRADEALGNWEWTERADLERELARWPVPATETLFVAREAGKVIGFCGVECYPGGEIGFVHGPVVESSARGRGVGRALFSVALRTSEKHNASELWAVTGRDNRRGQALLAEGGFTRGEACALFRLDPQAHTPLAIPEDVRRATSEDLPEVLALAESLVDDLHMSLDELASALVDPTWHVWISGRPNAVAIACIDPEDRWVRAVATHEDCRRRGLGATVLSAALSGWWADHPGETLGLTVRADSLAVLTQYHRLGFEPRLVVTRHTRTPNSFH
jgi:N-acetylglutamate synthase-like GNAT family acetyltransferase